MDLLHSQKMSVRTIIMLREVDIEHTIKKLPYHPNVTLAFAGYMSFN